MTTDLPGVRSAVAPRTAAQRSAVANGSRLFAETLDGRTALARRYRDLVALIGAEMGEDLTQTKQQLVRRAASLSVWCEAQEAKIAAGEDIDIGPYTTAANAVRRLLLDCGLERAAKDVTPTLDAYIAQTYGKGKS